MTKRYVSENLDLTRLPPPDVVKIIDYEVIFAARIAKLAERFAAIGIDFDTGKLETEPAATLQQEDAYREMLTLAAINDRARSVMIAFAVGADLENLGAFYGVTRHLITPADPLTGAAAVYEDDESLRKRIQLAPEALPYAGMTGGGYRSLALKTAPTVKDAVPIKRDGGRVDVVLLSRFGNGQVQSGVVTEVYKAFQDDEATQLTDVVAVRSAEIVEYPISVKLKVPLGPDHAVVRAAAKKAIEAYVAERHKVGKTIFLNGLIAAAKVGGVEDVVMITPTASIVPENDQAAYCTGVTVASELSE